MSNPTTPFGWQMPTNTDLVTDLPADFEVFGQAVATSMADLLGGASGYVLSKASATDMDFTWIPNDVGDITAVTAGTGISGGGTSGAVTVTNSMATAMTTSGDLIQATGSGTFARLATGTSGQYLTTNGTTNSWVTPAAAGGMTLISTTTLTGASVALTSIPQTYKDLKLVIKNFIPAINDSLLRFRFNGDSTASRHFNGASFNNISNNAPVTTVIDLTLGASSSVGTAGLVNVYVYDYTNAATWKNLIGYGQTNNATTTANVNFRFPWGFYNQTTAVTSITLLLDAGNFTSGTVLLYGVN